LKKYKNKKSFNRLTKLVVKDLNNNDVICFNIFSSTLEDISKISEKMELSDALVPF
jgi:hypothetical protein